ncbi:MAG: class I SAM-dependent methyltransferase [Povalibacter sp.]
MGPLLTLKVHEALINAARRDEQSLSCSLDLERSSSAVSLAKDEWSWQGSEYPYLENCKDRTIYHWSGQAFEAVARFTNSLIKLVPTDWGPPTFEIDGIKMLPTAQVSPYADAERKVALIRPRGKTILDTCGGLGYFAAWCLRGQAERILSFEKNADVIWLRSLNPWSPQSIDDPEHRLTLTQGDISEHIVNVATRSVDAVLHDPPRFGIAGELYSQSFYDQLARVLKPKGMLFHYTGSPNRLTSGRDVPNEVANRLRTAGFTTRLEGDGILAVRARR